MVLEPSGLVGRIESIEAGGDPAFVFDHIEHRERVSLANHDRYRPLMSIEEASDAERRLLETPAIAALSDGARSSRAKSVSHPPVDLSRHLDLYLEGTRAQRMAAFATALDWALEARARGETHGLWRGVLNTGRDYLLGELARVLGDAPEAYEARLLAQRAATTARSAPIDAPLEPAPPLARVEFYPSEGRHALGVLEVEDDLLVTQDVLATDPDSVEDGGFVQARPGPWHAFVHVDEDAKWLVLVHEDALELAREAPSFEGPDAMAPAVRTKRGGTLPLEEVGVCEVEGGMLGVFARAPSTETSRSVRHHPPDGTALWPWGLAHALGGDGPVPVYGAPSGPRDLLVIPAG